MEDKSFAVSGASAADFARAVFTNLFVLLEKKGVLTMKEIGQTLISDADDPELVAGRDEATAVYLRELGKALVHFSRRPAPPPD